MEKNISINLNKDIKISARELHRALNIGTSFRTWFRSILRRGFLEGRDYTEAVSEKPKKNQLVKEYLLTPAMAKAICVMQPYENVLDLCEYITVIENSAIDPNMVRTNVVMMDNKRVNYISLNSDALSREVFNMMASRRTELI